MNNQEALACFDKISKNYNYGDIEANIDNECSYDRESLLRNAKKKGQLQVEI